MTKFSLRSYHWRDRCAPFHKAVAIGVLAASIIMPIGGAHAMFGAYLVPSVTPNVQSVRTAALHGGTAVWAGSTAALAEVFARHGYRLDRIKPAGTVPRLFVSNVPPDLLAIVETTKRKALFIRIALPLVLAANESILAERKRIERFRAKLAGTGALALSERRWIAKIFARYDAPLFDFAELLCRVDSVPPSLAIAQSAEESGWGTSRFAREGNALFGQRIFKGTNGMTPRKRNPGERFRVRSFGRLLDGARAYADNLNAHPAYAGFRATRAALRRQGRHAEGLALVETLMMYSERRAAYVATIKRIIRSNRLNMLDRLRLGGRVPQVALGRDT